MLCEWLVLRLGRVVVGAGGSPATYVKVRLDLLTPPLAVSTSTSPLPGEGRGSVVTASLAGERETKMYYNS